MVDEGHNETKGPQEQESVPTVGYGDGAIGPGAVIGRYKLLRILGEGGYGIVYSAEQQRPVKRRLALKRWNGARENLQKLWLGSTEI